MDQTRTGDSIIPLSHNYTLIDRNTEVCQWPENGQDSPVFSLPPSFDCPLLLLLSWGNTQWINVTHRSDFSDNPPPFE